MNFLGKVLGWSEWEEWPLDVLVKFCPEEVVDELAVLVFLVDSLVLKDQVWGDGSAIIPSPGGHNGAEGGTRREGNSPSSHRLFT